MADDLEVELSASQGEDELEPPEDELDPPEDELDPPEDELGNTPICDRCAQGPIVQVRGAFVVLGYEDRDQVAMVYHHLPDSLEKGDYLVVCRDICTSCGQISAYIDPDDLPRLRGMVRHLDNEGA